MLPGQPGEGADGGRSSNTEHRLKSRADLGLQTATETRKWVMSLTKMFITSLYVMRFCMISIFLIV